MVDRQYATGVFIQTIKDAFKIVILSHIENYGLEYLSKKIKKPIFKASCIPFKNAVLNNNKIGNLYYFLIQKNIKPPLVNCVGESLKVTFENGAVMYQEVTSIAPMTVNIYIVGAGDSYFLSGYHRVRMTS